jgi:hypothetical protein
MSNIMTGEVVFGGPGSGLFGALLLVVLGVFLAGLMVGRTPEYLGKKLGMREVKLAALGTLFVPILVRLPDRLHHHLCAAELPGSAVSRTARPVAHPAALSAPRYRRPPVSREDWSAALDAAPSRPCANASSTSRLALRDLVPLAAGEPCADEAPRAAALGLA